MKTKGDRLMGNIKGVFEMQTKRENSYEMKLIVTRKR